MQALGFIWTWGWRVVGLATILIGLIGMRQNAFDATAIFGLSWLELVFASFAVASLFVVGQLGFHNYRLTHQRPRYRIQIMPTTQRVIRLQVVSENTLSARVNCRARAVQQLAANVRQQTEPFITCWEESDSQYPDITGGDHGTLLIGSYSAVGTPTHCLQMRSYRFGERHQFDFASHDTRPGGFGSTLTVELFSEPSPEGKRIWVFDLGDVHDSEGNQEYWYSVVQDDSLGQRIVRKILRR